MRRARGRHSSVKHCYFGIDFYPTYQLREFPCVGPSYPLFCDSSVQVSRVEYSEQPIGEEWYG